MAEEIGVDDDLHARLIAATKEGDGMATWAILQALGKPDTNCVVNSSTSGF